MKRKPTYKQAKAKACEAFSRYIRLKYSTEGICECITCGRKLPWKEAQCGHGIPGRSNGILFLEEICRPQCSGCNVFQAGRLDIFVPYLIDTYGRRGYDDFMRLKREPRKFTVTDLLAMAEIFEQTAKELAA